MIPKQYRVSPACMFEIEDALKEYYAAVKSSDLSQSSQASYIDKANNFVRWLRGEFDPGAHKAPYGVRDTKTAANKLAWPGS